MSDFRAALHRHLRAIQDKDLAGLANTVAPDELVLVMADGKVARKTSEFLEAHRGWFGMTGWRLEAEALEVREAGSAGIAVLRLNYRESEGAPPQESILTLVFEQRDGDWRMVLDQNTPVRTAGARS